METAYTELDYFVGNSNGRGLIRIEGHGTGEHVASAPRGAESEKRVAEVCRRYNCHADLLAALERAHTALFTSSRKALSLMEYEATMADVTAAIAKARGHA